MVNGDCVALPGSNLNAAGAPLSYLPFTIYHPTR
jgi:hypothetical protein